ncbi:MAG TPA: hypothetical protein VK092_07325 [Deinococcales bacterium]|nr:hypothetical protein [Deinococcales bacterium]
MPDRMDNPVYSAARRGLEQLVSPAAAASLLELTLFSAGLEPATVSAGEMRQLLRGPVLTELRHVLPESVLGRALSGLAADLPEPAAAPAAVSADRAAGPDPQRPAVRERRPTVTSGVRTDLPELRPPSRAELEAAVLRLAAADGVNLVVAVRSDGEPVLHRGSGDVARLARLGRLALTLLNRGDSVRFSLFTFSGTSLLLFPWADDALLLAGTGELNVGSAVATFNETVLYREDT